LFIPLFRSLIGKTFDRQEGVEEGERREGRKGRLVKGKVLHVGIYLILVEKKKGFHVIEIV
jgi:hypothetical protein